MPGIVTCTWVTLARWPMRIYFIFPAYKSIGTLRLYRPDGHVWEKLWKFVSYDIVFVNQGQFRLRSYVISWFQIYSENDNGMTATPVGTAVEKFYCQILVLTKWIVNIITLMNPSPYTFHRYLQIMFGADETRLERLFLKLHLTSWKNQVPISLSLELFRGAYLVLRLQTVPRSLIRKLYDNNVTPSLRLDWTELPNLYTQWKLIKKLDFCFTK